nr:MAG TPA: baseplate assembly protein [Caudoviricetes sp.]
MGIFDSYPKVDFIEGITAEKLEAEMLSAFQRKRKELTGVDEVIPQSDDRRIILATCAYYLFHAYEQIDFSGKMGLLKYSKGAYLDNLGAFKGLQRLKAKKAISTLRFTLSGAQASNSVVPKGTKVSTEDGLTFETIKELIISKGEITGDVDSECNIPGIIGNGYKARTITKPVDNIPYVQSVQNITESSSGVDLESDEDFRERIYQYPDSYTNGGTKRSYEYWIKKASQHIKDVYLGKRPNSTEIDVVLLWDNETGQYSDNDLAEVKAAIDWDKMPVFTDTLTFQKPTAKDYSIDLDYYLYESDKYREAEIKKAVEESVKDYIAWQRSKLGRDINQNELVRRCMVSGAKRVVVRNPNFTTVQGIEIANCTSMSVTFKGWEDD